MGQERQNSPFDITRQTGHGAFSRRGCSCNGAQRATRQIIGCSLRFCRRRVAVKCRGFGQPRRTKTRTDHRAEAGLDGPGFSDCMKAWCSKDEQEAAEHRPRFAAQASDNSEGAASVAHGVFYRASTERRNDRFVAEEAL